MAEFGEVFGESLKKHFQDNIQKPQNSRQGWKLRAEFFKKSMKFWRLFKSRRLRFFEADLKPQNFGCGRG